MSHLLRYILINPQFRHSAFMRSVKSLSTPITRNAGHVTDHKTQNSSVFLLSATDIKVTKIKQRMEKPRRWKVTDREPLL